MDKNPKDMDIEELEKHIEKLKARNMISKKGEIQEDEINKNENIKNRGKGAGGSNTNKNGLNYENQKELRTEYIITEKTIHL